MYVDDRTRTFGAYPIERKKIDTVAPSDDRRARARARLRKMRVRKGMDPDG